MISISNLTKHYGEQKAVNQISFTADRGEIVGFLGPNGAGKSTTMKMITGYLQADAGQVIVGGIDVKQDPISVKKKIGYLPEANPLYTDMYVREYLGFIAGIHGIADKKAAVEKLISLTGLTIESKKKIGQLSKGYKQRVGLAAALIHDPEVLILDEPTSGLDPNQIVEIRNVIRQQGKDKTVLFSSHILQEVEAICDRVIIIDRGNIVADDTLANLQKGKRDHHIVSVQFHELIDIGLLHNNIASIEHIDQPAPGNWKLQTNDPENVRKQLLQLAIDHNLNIVSLHSEKHNLEDIFRSLTKK
ncbi:gliding motility-associated ABC transporter ATP-binding subunit GldA [Sediminibacterium soli]|uniref:gliding motility-associated ABC transporter ATP-binding subunit GldA n=1 Tax=Sediminibacterium soli TaxID=2698829 RepID=UPI00137A3095|nr:gliding motility-associated ABC transporter ATP-binding subunit GldA [Sediminibacterium soli]NCI47560.1 gliding motility-associated ABC transporter ATP-binding subunit GldA [Sediminibacterium soli]